MNKRCVENCPLISGDTCCESCPIDDCRDRCETEWKTCVCRKRLLPAPSDNIRSVAVDFDGTLVTDRWPDVGEPNIALIDELNEHAALGCKIILWTCRSGDVLREAVEAAEGFGLRFDAVNENPFSELTELLGETRKVYADLYADDRAVNVRA